MVAERKEEPNVSESVPAAQAARILGVSKMLLTRARRATKIDGTRFRTNRLFSRSDLAILQAWLLAYDPTIVPGQPRRGYRNAGRKRASQSSA